MNPQMIDFSAKLLLGIAVAVISSWVTVRLSLRRFKTEALWNRKLDAYLKILEALHVERRHSEEVLLQFNRSYEYAKEHQEEMRKRTAQAHQELNRIVDIGALIISKDAVAYLREAIKPRYDDWENSSTEEFHDEEEAIYRKAIEKTIEIARADLKR